MSKTDNRPSHRAYAVTKNGERCFWQPIGAAWVHSDGWGFNLKLDYLPLNGAEIVLRKPNVAVYPGRAYRLPETALAILGDSVSSVARAVVCFAHVMFLSS
jgi:hypothetical protein